MRDVKVSNVQHSNLCVRENAAHTLSRLHFLWLQVSWEIIKTPHSRYKWQIRKHEEQKEFFSAMCVCVNGMNYLYQDTIWKGLFL